MNDVIVQRIEQYFSIAYNTEKTLKTTLMQSNSLRQSILMNAFEGKLVPQDASDEPAEKLLSRIRQQKIDEIKNNSRGLMSYVK
jgi:type I restriction enzyme S subunit